MSIETETTTDYTALIDRSKKFFVIEEAKRNNSETPELNLCYLGDSKIHGKGVFASRDIKEGELITFYPAHYVVMTPSDQDPNTNKEFGVLNSSFTNNKDLTDFLRVTYTFNIDENIGICGDPTITESTDFLGHMINDGCRGHYTKIPNPKDIKLYETITKLKRNSVIHLERDAITFVVASCDIKKDDEILISYGYPYWMQ